MRIDGKAEGPRQSMAWLHTWASLLLGWLLYAIFVTGTLSFFQNEITIWMKPELHQSLTHQNQQQQTATAIAYLQQHAPQAGSWSINLPTQRQTTTDIVIRSQGEDPRARRGGERLTLDTTTGEVLEARETRGGGFLYRFHFDLYGMPRVWARWIVGIATLLMFVAIISGVITHKKIFKDFFTFRAGKGQRSWLDAHNATAVFALPFHIMITFSGLLLLMYTLMPWGVKTAYEGGRQEFLQAQRQAMLPDLDTPAEQPKAPASEAMTAERGEGRAQPTMGEGQASTIRSTGSEQSHRSEQRSRTEQSHRPEQSTRTEHAPRSEQRGQRGRASQPIIAQTPAVMTDLAPLFAYAAQQWPNNRIATIQIISPNTTDAMIEFRAAYTESLAHRNLYPSLTFNGVTGDVITDDRQPNISLSMGIYNVVTVLHEGRGIDLALRWLLFLSGVLGTLMVATGLVLWSIKRAPQQQKLGYKPFGHRFVEVMNIAAVVGLPLAVAAYFYANRFIAADIDTRSALEIRSFFIVWLISLIYAACRPARQAWQELLCLSAILFLCIPLLNILTGGRPLWSSIYHAQWVVASFDLMALLLGALLMFAFIKVKRHQGLNSKDHKKRVQHNEDET